MAEVKNMVPYEWRVNARDLPSGKPVTNILYTKTADLGGGYATPIAASSHATLADEIWQRWNTWIVPQLSEQYEVSGYISRAIIGRRWPTPMIPIVGISPLLTATRISTGVPHGMSTGNSVEISGATGSPTVNGVHASITVITATAFDIAVTGAAASPGPGQVQRASGVIEFVYDDKQEVVVTATGAITGESLPVYCTISLRRLNVGVGRNFRSRISLSPLGESQQANGGFTPAALALIQTAGSNLVTVFDIGGGNTAKPVAVSKQLAFAEPPVFLSSSAWSKDVTAYVARPNLGSLTRRKPKLTQGLA